MHSLRPIRARHAVFSARSLGLTVAIALGAAACDAPAAAWVDDGPVATRSPSPLAHPPFVPFDSVQRDGTAESDFLLSSDLMREAGAASLLTQVIDSTAWSREKLTPDSTVAPNATAAAGASMTPADRSAMDMSSTDMSSMDMTGASQSAHDVAPLGNGDSPRDSLRCARSLRIVEAPGRGRVAVWWSRRSGSRVALLAAWRDSTAKSTGAWRGPFIVDSLDQGPVDARASERGAAGCARPAPSIAVDDQLGYVHVAYVLVGPEGPGVFYAHQMDPRAAFEPAQVIMYGERLGAARVAASGTVVAVAYEDPNSGERTRVGLAVSRSSGHVFEPRLVASGTTTIARDPYVLVRGRAVVMGWSELPGGEPSFKMRRAKIN